MLNTAEVPKTTPPTTGQFYGRKYTRADLPVVLTADRVTITDFTIIVLDVNSNLVIDLELLLSGSVRATFNATVDATVDATVLSLYFFLFIHKLAYY